MFFSEVSVDNIRFFLYLSNNFKEESAKYLCYVITLYLQNPYKKIWNSAENTYKIVNMFDKVASNNLSI